MCKTYLFNSQVITVKIKFTTDRFFTSFSTTRFLIEERNFRPKNKILGKIIAQKIESRNFP